ncbi:MAG: Asparagine synthetase [Parcubacteria group bacterium GW2011_GWA2_49_9]|nr:MAG: Asparagine synthetase [Parcubacteria group bacterium GW2011_GWA2_49_9]
MCSINGFTWGDEDLIKRMNRVTAHRGPDGTGMFVESGISLGHNRLAIIDLSSAGTQPMKGRDERFVISFNGEIYNYRELKKELGNVPWKSESDTEVILAAYEAWGESAFARLEGIFAFALWDTREQKLLLVRDPAGVKPLYYHFDGTRLVFSSEIKAILEHTHIPRRIDPLSLDLYLRVLYTPAPLTMFEGIRKLLPGAVLSFKNGSYSVATFAKRKPKSLSQKSRKELARELRDKTHESVKRQLMSDRPVGLYLSGGIDSSAVLESMARVSGKVETFSVGFELKEGEQQEKFNADFLLARETAKRFGTKHHEVLVGPDEAMQLFEEAIYHLDEPSANATIIPMLKLARFAKEKVAVVLGGDGGDELFGGYERYQLSLLSSLYRRFPAALRSLCDGILPPLRKLDTAPGIERFAQFHFLKEHELLPLISKKAYHPHTAHDFFIEHFFTPVREPFETQFLETDRHSWLVDESLLRSDKLSMAAGLEARVPLLDLPLIDFAGTIPLHYKVSLRRTKIMLKEAFRGSLPDTLLRQPKRGWFSPGAKWLRYPQVADAARKILSKDYSPATKDLFDWDAVGKRLEAHISGEYHATILLALIGLQVWAKRFDITKD